MGIPKTGSSALQQCLAQNREQLRECGVTYPDYKKDKAGEGVVCSGNGGVIGYYFKKPFFKPQNIDFKNQIKSWLKSDSKYLVYSSEAIYSYIDTDKLKKLEKLLNDNDAELEFMFYIRSIIGYLYSWHNQFVRAGYSKDFAHYIRNDFDEPHKESLRLMGSGFKVVCRNYDNNDKGSEYDFIHEYLGCNMDNIKVEKQSVNSRTLSAQELDLFIELNRELKVDHKGDKIRAIILNHLPEKKGDRAISKEDYNYLKDKYNQLVKELNKSFSDLKLTFDDPKIKIV